jgi:peptide/nickel transport system substrate-binding protein
MDIPWLEQDPLVTLRHKTSNRVIYLQMDTDRTVSPFVRDRSGGALATNPFKDRRIRLAISKALDRNGIVERIMNGNAVPAAQVLPDGYFGVSPHLAPELCQPEQASNLLAEAGFGDGFQVTLHAASDSYENGTQTALAIAQMLRRIGIAVDVQTIPRSIWSTRAAALDFSFMLAAWGSESGEISAPLRGMIASFDPKKGWGTSNRGRYANPTFDKLFERATTETDISTREQLLQQASEFAMKDVAIIPLYFEVATWAARRGITYEPRSDGYTFAHQFHGSRD